MVSVWASGTSGSYTNASTDTTGAFTLRGVPDGQVVVQANLMGNDRRAKPKTITVENGAAAPVEINFEEGFTVRGRVTFNGVAASDGFINFRPHDNSNNGGSGRVTAGSYEISGLGAGDYEVTMNSNTGGYRGKYTVSGSGTFDIDVRGATLRGHVVDAATGAPVPDATVAVSGRGSTAFNNVVSDSDGHFVVPALLDGTYTVSVRRDTYSPATQSVEVSNGSAPDVEVRLEGGTPVTVVVVDAISGVALPMANVMIESEGKRMAGGMARGDDGAHIWLKPGHYRAIATAYPYVQSPPTDLDVPGPAVRIALSKGDSLIIVAKSAGRARLSVAAVSVPVAGVVRPIAYAPGANMPIEGLTPGSYTLEILDSHNAFASAHMEVRAVN